MPKEYFSHDYNTRNKKRLSAIIHDYGMKGYGLFWVIVEMLHEDSNNWMEMEDFTYISISKESGCTLPYVKDFIGKCISIYKVFMQEGEKFTTERVLRNVEKRLEIKEKRSKAGKASALVKQKSTHVEQKPTNKRKGKERKGNKKKEENTAPSGVSEAEASPVDPLELYGKLGKDKKAICDFIKNNHPEFIEPYVDLWNLFASEKGFSKVSKISDHRKKKFKTRIGEKAFDFIEILKKAGQSEFVLKNTWFSFDWILEDEMNYLKTIEGKYGNKNFDTQKNNGQDPATDLQYLYETFLEGRLNKKLVKAEHFDLISSAYPLTDQQLAESKKRRIQMLTGSNQAGDLRLLQDYQNEISSDLLKQDQEVILRIAKKMALMEYFQLLKSVNAKNVTDGIKHTTTISA